MWLRMLTAALVVVGAAVALLLGTSRGASRVGHPQDGVRPTQLPVATPPRPAGSVVFGRNVGESVFSDDTRGLSAVALGGPDRVQITHSMITCCPAWSRTRHVLAASVDGPHGPALATLRVGVDTYRPLSFEGSSTGLLPGGWAPQGNWIAVTRSVADNGQPAGVYIGTLGEGRPLRLVTRTPPQAIDRVLSVSPDGTHLLLFRARATGNKRGVGVLYTIGTAAHGQGLVRLTPPHSYSWCCYFGTPASWSPDGSHVAFAAFNGGAAHDASRSAVFVVRWDGAFRVRITAWRQWTTSAKWSPTGDWIAFDRVNDAPFHHDLFITRPNGSNTHVIVTRPANGGSCCAQWSPDGHYLIYEHGPNDRHQALYVVNIGRRPVARRLTGFGGSYFSFAVAG